MDPPVTELSKSWGNRCVVQVVKRTGNTTVDYRRPPPELDDACFQPGSWLGPYRLEGRLGRGGMGVVLEATDTRLQRRVALKLLPQDLQGGIEQLIRFEREARLLASLNHPNIATIHSLEFLQGMHFLTMELIPGETLDALIKQQAGSVDWAIRTGCHVAEALQAAHLQGVIHCDLKPSNILVTPDGVVKVLDFGIARALGQEADALVIGTPGYMSPEQINGRKVDARADFWAFGAILFEMLSGQSAIVGSSIGERMAATLKQDPDWSRLPADLPESLRQLIEQCLSRDAAQRPADVSQLLAALDAAKRQTALGIQALEVGDRAPDFALTDERGRLVRSAELLARGPLVLHFYRGQW